MAGLGTWLSSEAEADDQVDAALEAGIRLIDNSILYENEAPIGKTLRRWMDTGRLKRKDLFVVSKLPIMGMEPCLVEFYVDMSLKNLGLDYFDLYLIHTPFGIERDDASGGFKMVDGKAVLKEEVDHVGIWREMERLVDEGKLKSLGVSNFNSDQIERLNDAARIPIAVNQVECSPYFQQRKLRAAMDKLGIRMMAYASLGSTGRRKYSSTLRTGKNPVVHNLLEDPTVLSVAERRSKTPAQIILRYLVQLGMVVIPKSSKRDRIVENFSIFDFVLDPEDMAALGGLDKGSAGRTFNGKLELGNWVSFDKELTRIKDFPFAGKDEY